MPPSRSRPRPPASRSSTTTASTSAAPRSYYVSFDNEDVGKLQGQTLVDCLNASNAKNPQIIEMDGGKDVDNNAVLFANGANAVLKPLDQPAS